MLIFLAPLALLAALWLWHPLLRTGKKYYAIAVIATAILGALPAMLIWAIRNTTVSYTAIAYLQVPAGWLFASIAGAWAVAVLRDTVAVLGKMLRYPGVAKILWQPHYTLIVMSAMLLVCGHGAIQGLRVPAVREQELPLAKLPRELDGLRIAVIADSASRRDSRIRQLDRPSQPPDASCRQRIDRDQKIRFRLFYHTL